MKTHMKAIEKGVINKDNLMPRFDGSIDAYWWLIQVYQYLKALKICKEKWLSWVWTGLDGEVQQWWFSWRKTNQKVELFYFEKTLLVKFKPEFGAYLQVPGKEQVMAKA
jgi:hypothetical protein